MHNLTYAVLDTETTGFYYDRGDRLVEIAAVKIRDGKIVPSDNFQSMINPERSIPLSASRVNHITDEMVTAAPKFAEIIDQFEEFLADVDYVFIHNAKFDLSFLKAEYARCQRALKLPKVVCSVELSKAFYPELRTHNLNAIAKRFDLEIKEGELRHRALGDVILTGEVILKFYEENPLIFLGSLESLENREFCG